MSTRELLKRIATSIAVLAIVLSASVVARHSLPIWEEIAIQEAVAASNSSSLGRLNNYQIPTYYAPTAEELKSKAQGRDGIILKTSSNYNHIIVTSSISEMPYPVKVAVGLTDTGTTGATITCTGATLTGIRANNVSPPQSESLTTLTTTLLGDVSTYAYSKITGISVTGCSGSPSTNLVVYVTPYVALPVWIDSPSAYNGVHAFCRKNGNDSTVCSNGAVRNDLPYSSTANTIDVRGSSGNPSNVGPQDRLTIRVRSKF